MYIFAIIYIYAHISDIYIYIYIYTYMYTHIGSRSAEQSACLKTGGILTKSVGGRQLGGANIAMELGALPESLNGVA